MILIFTSSPFGPGARRGPKKRYVLGPRMSSKRQPSECAGNLRFRKTATLSSVKSCVRQVQRFWRRTILEQGDHLWRSPFRLQWPKALSLRSHHLSLGKSLKASPVSPKSCSCSPRPRSRYRLSQRHCGRISPTPSSRARRPPANSTRPVIANRRSRPSLDGQDRLLSEVRVPRPSDVL